MAVLWVVLAEEYGRKGVLRDRYFAERTTALENYDDVALLRKFRFPKKSILSIIDICRPYLSRNSRRSRALPVAVQVLAALRLDVSNTKMITQNEQNLTKSKILIQILC